MIPTMKFRWLEVPLGAERNSATASWNELSVSVLQQWWENELPTIVAHGTDYVETERKGEWRDIPVEEQA